MQRRLVYRLTILSAVAVMVVFFAPTPGIAAGHLTPEFAFQASSAFAPDTLKNPAIHKVRNQRRRSNRRRNRRNIGAFIGGAIIGGIIVDGIRRGARREQARRQQCRAWSRACNRGNLRACRLLDLECF